MRLDRVKLINWRSIPSCDIDLSADVTVVIGDNSAGKTALLNAFVWGLYEQTTPGFSKPADLCNHQSKLRLNIGETTVTSVELSFFHGSGEAKRRYVAKRSLDIRRTGPGESDFETGKPQFFLNVYPLGRSGDAWNAHGQQAEQEVRSIIPASLSPYFFFPAENIGSAIGSPDAKAASVKEAVSVLLGLKRYEVALSAVRTALEMPKLKEKASNDTEISKAQQHKNSTKGEYMEAEAKLKELNKEIGRVEAMQSAAKEEADKVQFMQELITERTKIQMEIERAEEAQKSAWESRLRVLSKECFNLFGTAVLAEAHKVLERAKREEKIPPKVSAGLLDELINRANGCICGQPLNDSSRDALRRLRQGIVEDQLAELASNVLARVSDLHGKLLARGDDELSHEMLNAASVSISNADRAVATWRISRDDFDAKNPGVGRSTTSNPFGAYIQHSNTLEALHSRRQELQNSLHSLSEKSRQAELDYEKLLDKRGKADKVSKARSHLIHIEQAIEDILQVLRDGSRCDLERAIDRIASKVLLRDYAIHLTPDFEIEAKQNGIEIGRSSSEHAWVTFAFVGAIAGLIDMYDRNLDNMDEAGNIELEPGSGYPLVLDAPFSPFGETYATEFAERLFDLAPQSVLIVREDQLAHLDPILSAGPGRVRAYLMCLHGPPKSDTREIVWRDGSARVYFGPASDWEDIRTTIEELPI